MVTDGSDPSLKQAMHEATYQQSPIGTALYAPDGRLLDLNPAALLLTGFPDQERAAQYTLFDFSFLTGSLKPETLAKGPVFFTFQYDFDQAAREGRSHSARTGTAFFEVRVLPLQDPDCRLLGYLVLIQDISERQQSETALSESEFRYRILFENAGDSLVVCNFQNKILDVNRTMLELLGYERNELINRSLLQICSPATVERFPEQIARLQASGQTTFEGEYLAKNGRAIPAEVNARVIEYNGQPVILGVARDISERTIAEKRIAELNERFAKAFELNPMPMVLSFYEGGKILDVNQSFLKIFGFHKSEISGLSSIEAGILTIEERSQMLSKLGQNRTFHSQVLQMRTKYGQCLEGMFSSAIITLGSRKCLLSTFSRTRIIPPSCEPPRLETNGKA